MATVLNRSTDMGDPPSNIEAGTSPVGIGGVLSNAPAALFPVLPDATPPVARVALREAVVFQDPEPLPPDKPLHLPALDVVSAASARVAQQGGVLSESEVVAFLREAGAPEAWIPDLVTISWCESHHSPFALGDSGNSLGQYQLWSGWARPMGFTPDDLFDPLKAAQTAVYVRSVRGRFGGTGGWSCADLNGIR